MPVRYVYALQRWYACHVSIFYPDLGGASCCIMRAVAAIALLAVALQVTLAVRYHRTVSYKGQVVVGW